MGIDLFFVNFMICIVLFIAGLGLSPLSHILITLTEEGTCLSVPLRVSRSTSYIYIYIIFVRLQFMST